MGGYRPNGNGYTQLDWCATIGGMVHRDTRVRASCKACGTCLEVDTLALLLRLGPKATLLNRRPRCRVVVGGERCTGRVLFIASPGPSTPFMPCLTPASDNVS